jgi:hypothetical protein
LAVGGTFYFALIGIGFMMVEIGLLQRMSVFLGHPTYALSVVLFSLILWTGVGSMTSERVRLAGAGKLVVWSAASACYLFALSFWLPLLLADLDGARKACSPSLKKASAQVCSLRAMNSSIRCNHQRRIVRPELGEFVQ